ncbi:MAG TPA: hypothetical protein DEF78_20350 [Sphingobacterium sp.]|nr:hypothetical protein [Sphingobacterium sp.]
MTHMKASVKNIFFMLIKFLINLTDRPYFNSLNLAASLFKFVQADCLFFKMLIYNKLWLS